MTTQHTLRRAVFPGSFDLFTLGHLDVLRRSLALFDEVIVALAVNAKKKYFFDVDTRMRLVKEIMDEELTPQERERVRVEYSQGEFIVNFARDQDAKYLVRGLRGLDDFADEYKNRVVNLHVNPDIEIVYVICPPALLAVSSSAVKENVGLDGWEDLARQFVPPAAMRGLEERARQLAQGN
jgi:pantetheine-phosphate adenylyltransferase/8-oxo-dGTP diphosphatase